MVDGIKNNSEPAQTANQEKTISENLQLKTKKSHWWLAGVIIITIVLSSFFGAVFGFMAGGSSNLILSKIEGRWGKIFSGASKSSNSSTSKETVVQEESAVTDVVEKATSSVVSIVISKDVTQYRRFSPFEFFFGPDSGRQDNSAGDTIKQKIGGGSGFFVSEDGMIATNKHVVEDMTADYTVITNDGQEYPAKVLARDPVRDIAVIKIDGSNFSVLALGDSDNLKIGQTAIAIGNSLGEFANSVSRGIISGLGRNVSASSSFGEREQLNDIIQTDAAINPGNSGGPLLDISGQVIGVNVAVAQGAENIGFALPINQVKKIVEQVKTKGKISTPYIGVRYVILDSVMQKRNNLPFDYGALVMRGQSLADLAVVPGSPADKAGIVENDIILEINGEKITAENQLSDAIAKFDVGEQVSCKIWHKGEIRDLKLTFEERQ